MLSRAEQAVGVAGGVATVEDDVTDRVPGELLALGVSAGKIRLLDLRTVDWEHWGTSHKDTQPWGYQD